MKLGTSASQQLFGGGNSPSSQDFAFFCLVIQNFETQARLAPFPTFLSAFIGGGGGGGGGRSRFHLPGGTYGQYSSVTVQSHRNRTSCSPVPHFKVPCCRILHLGFDLVVWDGLRYLAGYREQAPCLDEDPYQTVDLHICHSDTKCVRSIRRSSGNFCYSRRRSQLSYDLPRRPVSLCGP